MGLFATNGGVSSLVLRLVLGFVMFAHGSQKVLGWFGGTTIFLAYDERRTAKMGEDGYRVIRFWNSEVLSNIDGLLEAIGNALEKDPAPPS